MKDKDTKLLEEAFMGMRKQLPNNEIITESIQYICNYVLNGIKEGTDPKELLDYMITETEEIHMRYIEDER